jgi:hypothetical protein
MSAVRTVVREACVKNWLIIVSKALLFPYRSFATFGGFANFVGDAMFLSCLEMGLSISDNGAGLEDDDVL